MQFFTMVRKGKIIPKESTKNQCKFEGFNHYVYAVKVAFAESQPLDENGFLVDNTEIDTCICELELEGSCEQMHEKMLRATQELMDRKGVQMVAYKASLLPYNSTAGDISHIDKVWIDDLTWGGDPAVLLNLVNT